MMINAWTRRNRALFVALPDGEVFAVRGDWWVGRIEGERIRANWRKLSHRS
jgi:hypothetical protein